jgi:hypothetical protein
MARQLHLLLQDDGPRDWRLDDSTRTLGLQGLAQARAALRDARAATTSAAASAGTATSDERTRKSAA